MATYVIWMDSEKAQIFNLKPTGIEKSHVEKHTLDHHTHNKKDHHGDPALDHFFKDLATKLKDAEELLIMGPGLAKNHFKTHLEDHQGGALAKKIVGLENSDHPTDNQILATARSSLQPTTSIITLSNSNLKQDSSVSGTTLLRKGLNRIASVV